jgi:hypothetical protein
MSHLKLMFLLSLLAVAACVRAPKSADSAMDRASGVYALSVVALEVADAASVAWLAGLEQPTEADIARGEQLVQALEAAHATLTRARAALVAGQDALSDVKEALAVLRLAASLLGSQAPPGLLSALDGAERVLGREP